MQAGAELDVRRPYRGEALPDDLDEHTAMVILGGTMGADDDADFSWLGPVKALVREAVTTHTPTLGICLGHQLCASALGGRVERNPRGQQVGVLQVGWTAAAADDTLFASLAEPVCAVQWNNDIVTELPAEAVLLAQTPHGEVQAARFAPTVWGVQWHPEVDADIVRVWAENDREDAALNGVDLDAYVAQVADAEAELRATWSRLADRFVTLTEPVGRAGG